MSKSVPTSADSNTYCDYDGTSVLSDAPYVCPVGPFWIQFSVESIELRFVETIEDKFRRLADRWNTETMNLSSFDQMVDHPAYKAIISMGPAVVPYLLSDLKNEPQHWFYALRKITGANPIPRQSAGKLDEMTAAWLKWGQKQGYC